MRKVFLVSGIISLLVAWASPLPGMARHAFYSHMIMHMLVVAIAAPFLALSLIGTKFDLSMKYLRLFSPIPAATGELILVWGWHAPYFHHFARTTHMGLFLEQFSFLVAGIWVWLACLGGKPGNKGAGVIGLLLTSMHMTFLGALLSLSTRPIYNHHHAAHGFSILEDQHIGGAIMLIVGGISYLSGGLWLTMKMLKEKGRLNEELA